MDLMAPLSVVGWGWGRWNTALTPLSAILMREPRPSEISAPKALSKDSMSFQTMEASTGFLKIWDRVSRFRLFK